MFSFGSLGNYTVMAQIEKRNKILKVEGSDQCVCLCQCYFRSKNAKAVVRCCCRCLESGISELHSAGNLSYFLYHK